MVEHRNHTIMNVKISHHSTQTSFCQRNSEKKAVRLKTLLSVVSSK